MSPDKAEESLTKALEGDVSSRGSRSALLVFQAVARAYASHYERKNGTVEEVTAYCPLCGSESRTMVRVGEEYLLVCHLCGYAWRVSRKTLACPFCGNSNPFSIGIFMDKDGRLGLAYCQECGSSWRVVLDERVASAPRILLPLLALAAERLRGALPGGASGEELHEGSSEGQLGGGNDEAQGQQ
ncbi:MAG: Protein involved in formate dehydrogenase formation [uncultured Acidilobus sp. OSP8]|nr:MAG: Protein involved in formate dehydrogenase formation [uncultured Acidilobus sp. OSP8]